MKGQQAAVRLSLALAVLIAILIAIGQLGLSRMDEINANREDIVGRHRNKVRLARDALTLSNANSRLTMEIFLLRDRAQIDAALASRTQNTAVISTLLGEIEKRCESREEASLLSEVKEARAPYIESYLRALHLLVDKQNREAGTAVIVQETLPNPHKYHHTWNRFLEFQSSQMDAAIEQSRTHYAKTRRLVSMLIGFAVIVAGAIALFVTRDIAREMKSRVAAELEVSKLNRELEQRVVQRTEQLALAEEQTRHSLTELREYTQEIEAINQILELLESCLTLDEAHRQVARALSRYFSSGALLMVNSSRYLLDQAASWGAPAMKPGPFQPESCWALQREDSRRGPGQFRPDLWTCGSGAGLRLFVRSRDRPG
jgi:methyl-accepting chemotaxis protein